MSFKVGDRVRRTNMSHGACDKMIVGSEWVVAGFSGSYVKVEGLEGISCEPLFFELVEVAPTHRGTDPATSKGKRKVNKYEQAVLEALAGAHLNGKEIAEVTGHPLNCITPRFAPLRRKGLIEPSRYDKMFADTEPAIVKRDKQIVWRLV